MPLTPVQIRGKHQRHLQQFLTYEQMFGAYHVSGGLRELGRALFERATTIWGEV